MGCVKCKLARKESIIGKETDRDTIELITNDHEDTEGIEIVREPSSRTIETKGDISRLIDEALEKYIKCDVVCDRDFDGEEFSLFVKKDDRIIIYPDSSGTKLTCGDSNSKYRLHIPRNCWCGMMLRERYLFHWLSDDNHDLITSPYYSCYTEDNTIIPCANPQDISSPIDLFLKGSKVEAVTQIVGALKKLNSRNGKCDQQDGQNHNFNGHDFEWIRGTNGTDFSLCCCYKYGPERLHWKDITRPGDYIRLTTKIAQQIKLGRVEIADRKRIVL